MIRQKTFFEELKSKLPSNIRLVDTISDLLNISTDSAYRRIRCEKELTLSELSKLCDNFHISIDGILNYETDNAIFKYVPLDMSDMNTYCTYMERLASLYESLVSEKRKSILATAQDILVFHFLPFIELTFFKLYVWNQSVSTNQMVSYEEFIKSLDKERLIGIYNRIIDAYNQIPSTEIWTTDTMNAILSSIEYYYDMECFEKKESILLILHQIMQLIENVNTIAENGVKEHKGRKTEFKMFLCPIHMENNFLVTNKNGIKTTSIKLYTINGIISSNKSFCDESEKWIDNLISKSINFTGASARERFKFFQLLKNKVNYLFERLDNDYKGIL